MTVKETTDILRILKAVYPQYYMNLSLAEESDIISIWSELFEYYDVEDVKKGLKNFIKYDVVGTPPII